VFFQSLVLISGARGSIVGWGVMLQVARSSARFLMTSLDFSVNVILPAQYGPEVYSASNRNEYQESTLEINGRQSCHHL
jgi:hypothetical protein